MTPTPPYSVERQYNARAWALVMRGTLDECRDWIAQNRRREYRLLDPQGVVVGEETLIRNEAGKA